MGQSNNPEDRILTIPNILSFIRIVLIVPMTIFFLNKNYLVAAICIFISAFSDMFDGMIARRFNQVTKLGKILDPIADKLTLVAIIICIGIMISKARVLVVILVAKDLLMLLGGAYLIHLGVTPPAAKWYGKAATVIFYISIIVIVGIDLIGGDAASEQYSLLILILLAVTSAAMIFALVMYGILFFRLLNEKKHAADIWNNS